MPVQPCSKDGKPGFQFGESGACYTYTSGDSASMKEAKAKAHKQEIAARASGWTEKSDSTTAFLKETNMQINLPYDNAQQIKKQHDSMSAWHQSMADQHNKAASWHAGQSDMLSKALQEVPLDPSTVPVPAFGTHGNPTAVPNGPTPPVTNVPLDPIKKSEFVQILKDHADLFGDLGAPIEEIAESILGI